MKKEIDLLKPDGRLCCKCEKPAVYINGATIPVCPEHDMEDTPNKDRREAFSSIGWPV